jgi:hypothetical protein
MTPDASRWRAPHAYAYLDQLIASDLAWEYLRRNRAYQDDFAAARPEAAARALSVRWGLRFPGRTRFQRR